MGKIGRPSRASRRINRRRKPQSSSSGTSDRPRSGSRKHFRESATGRRRFDAMDARNYAFRFYAAERHVVERTHLARIHNVFYMYLASYGVFDRDVNFLRFMQDLRKSAVAIDYFSAQFSAIANCAQLDL